VSDSHNIMNREVSKVTLGGKQCDTRGKKSDTRR
jgi:hypothetical protein